MNITSVKVQKTNVSDTVKANLTVTLDGELVIHDVKIVEVSGKLFIGMPSRKESGGRWLDIVHPITKQAREQFDKAVFEAYNEHLAKLEEKRTRDGK